MANAVKGEVGFEAGGEQHVFRLSYNALCNLEDAFGRPIMEVFAELETKLSLKTIRTIFAAGVGVDDETAGELLQEIGVEKAGEIMSEAIALAFPEAKASGKPKGRPGPGPG